MKEIDHLRERARSFRRRAEWMMDGSDRDGLLDRAREYDIKALALLQGVAPA